MGLIDNLVCFFSSIFHVGQMKIWDKLVVFFAFVFRENRRDTTNELLGPLKTLNDEVSEVSTLGQSKAKKRPANLSGLTNIARQAILNRELDKKIKRDKVKETIVEEKPLSFKENLLSLIFEIWNMFSEADCSERILLFFGTLFAIINGATYPFLALFFGKMSKNFFSESGPLNQTSMDGFTITDYGGYTKENFTTDVSTYSFYYFYFAIGTFFVMFFQVLTWEWVAENLLYRRRVHFIYELCREELPWLQKKTLGNVIYTFADNLERIREGTGFNFSLIIEYSSIFVFGAGVAYLTNQMLTLIFLASLPLYLTKYLILGKVVVSRNLVYHEKISKANNASVEVLNGIWAVNAYGSEISEAKRYEELLDEAKRENSKIFHLVGLAMGVLFVVAYGVYAIGFYNAVKLLINHTASTGDLYLVFFSVTISIYAVTNSFQFISLVTKAKSSFIAYDQLFQKERKIDPFSNIETDRKPITSTGKIEFQNVSYKFPLTTGGFNDLKFTVNSRKFVAIIGLPPISKDTLVDLLLRFSDPIKGYIRYDDIDLKDLNLYWYRRQIAVASENPSFFDSSLMHNLYRKQMPPRHTQEFQDLKKWIIKCAKIAGVHEQIERLPHKYHSKLIFEDVSLPSGLKERLGLARALAQKSKLLILNNLMSGERVKQLLRILKQDNEFHNLTVLWLSSKASKCVFADYIYVMHENKIVEKGTPDELKVPGTYLTKMLEAERMPDILDTPEPESVTGSIDDGHSAVPEQQTFIIKQEQQPDILKRRGKIRGEESETDPLLVSSGSETDTPDLGFDEFLEGQDSIFLFGLFGSVLYGAASPLLAYILGNIFSAVMIMSREDESKVEASAMYWAGMIVLVAFLAGIATWIQHVFLSIVAQNITFRMKLICFFNILRQQCSWFNTHGSPENLHSRISTNVTAIEFAFGPKFGAALAPLFGFLAVVIFASALSWPLGIGTFIVFLIILALLGYWLMTLLAIQKQLSESLEFVVRLVRRLYQNIWDIQAFSRAMDVCSSLNFYFNKMLRESRKHILIYAFALALMKFIFLGLLGGLFRFAAHLVLINMLLPGSFFTIFFIIVFSSISLGISATFISDYCKARVSFKRISPVISQKSIADPLDFPTETTISKLSPGKIEFQNVNFTYSNGCEVLKDFTLTIEAKTSVAIVSRIGGGRSTVFGLLERFYDVEDGKGEILIDGVNIKTLPISVLRANIGYVFEHPIIFDRSIAENIAYGASKDLSPEQIENEIERAAIESDAIEFINFLPKAPKPEIVNNEQEAITVEPSKMEKYEYQCGDKGSKLTLAEKQLVSLARAVFRDPPILLLDDPTSSLGADGENDLIESIQKVMENRTVIIASKSPKLIKICSKIAVIGEKKIIQFGTHDDLIKDTRGLYYQLMKAS